MKKIFISIVFFIFVTVSVLYAAGSAIVVTYSEIGGHNSGMSTLTYTWTSDDTEGYASSGINFTAGTGQTIAGINSAIAGKYVILAITVPGVAPNAPTPLYDIAINGPNGGDIMGAVLGDRSATATEQMMPYLGNAYGPRPITGALSPAITNAGNSKTGVIILVLSS